MKLDQLDIKILELLQDPSMLSPKLSKIAKSVGTTNATVYRRINAMKKEGVITGVSARIDTRLVYSGSVDAIVYLRLQKGMSADEKVHISNRLAEMQNVGSVYVPIGRWNYIIRTTHKSIDDLNRFVHEELGKLPVADFRVEVLSRVLKESSAPTLKQKE